MIYKISNNLVHVDQVKDINFILQPKKHTQTLTPSLPPSYLQELHDAYCYSCILPLVD